MVRMGCGRLMQTDGRLQAAMKSEYDAAMADPAQAEQIKQLQATMADPGMQQQMAGVSAMMNVRFSRPLLVPAHASTCNDELRRVSNLSTPNS